MGFLEVNNIIKAENGITILSGLSFSLEAGKKLALMGETGSGKSSLMKVVSGLLQADEGSVYFEDKKVLGPLEVLIPGHKGIAYLSQHFELLKNYRVADLLDMANKMNDQQASQVYRICNITHLLNRKTNQLSGGERQRIALSRLLVTQPRLLILDEPFTNLDLAHKRMINGVVQRISDELRVTCILVSHDPQEVLPWADEIMVLKGGSIMQRDTTSRVYHHPVNTYVAGLLGDHNTTADMEDEFLQQIGVSYDKPIIIRPEELKPSTDPAQGAMVTIVAKKFLGTHHLLEVQAGKAILKLCCDAKGFNIGEQIRIRYEAAI